jgi:hypothetical protein
MTTYLSFQVVFFICNLSTPAAVCDRHTAINMVGGPTYYSQTACLAEAESNKARISGFVNAAEQRIIYRCEPTIPKTMTFPTFEPKFNKMENYDE